MLDLSSWPEGDNIDNIMSILTCLTAELKKIKIKGQSNHDSCRKDPWKGGEVAAGNNACLQILIQLLLLHREPESNYCRTYGRIGEQSESRLMVVQIHSVTLNPEHWSNTIGWLNPVFILNSQTSYFCLSVFIHINCPLRKDVES